MLKTRNRTAMAEIGCAIMEDRATVLPLIKLSVEKSFELFEELKPEEKDAMKLTVFTSTYVELCEVLAENEALKAEIAALKTDNQ